MAVKFSLGQIVSTPGALRALGEAGQRPEHFLALHASGSWGDLRAEDRRPKSGRAQRRNRRHRRQPPGRRGRGGWRDPAARGIGWIGPR